MEIAYLINQRTNQQIILEQTTRLCDRGHEVKILALKGEELNPNAFKAEVIQVEKFGGMIPVSDIIVACFGGAALPACRVIKEIPFYLIQEYETPLYTQSGYKRICENSYKLPLNLLCASRELKVFLERRFFRKVHLIPYGGNIDQIEEIFDRAIERYRHRSPQDWHPWEKVIMLTPDDAWAHCAFGNELRQMGYLHRAKDELEMAIDLNPDIPFAYREMGKLFSEMGEYHKALKYLKIAREKRYHLAMSNSCY